MSRRNLLIIVMFIFVIVVFVYLLSLPSGSGGLGKDTGVDVTNTSLSLVVFEKNASFLKSCDEVIWKRPFIACTNSTHTTIVIPSDPENRPVVRKRGDTFVVDAVMKIPMYRGGFWVVYLRDLKSRLEVNMTIVRCDNGCIKGTKTFVVRG